MLAVLGVVMALRRLATGHGTTDRPLDRRAALTVLGGLMGMGAVFMATSTSSWLWGNLALLRDLQFPWRWLEVGAFFVALACGYLAHQIGGRQWWRIAFLAASLMAFFASAVPYLYPPRMKWLPEQPTLADITWAQQRYGIYGLTSWGEYTTRAVPASAWPQGPPFPGADLGASLDSKLQQSNLPDGALVSADGDAWHATLHLALAAETRLVFDSHYFPGWAARIDGEPAPVSPDEEGRLSVAVSAGEHVLSIGFGRTPIRWVADVASLTAALGVVLAMVWPRHKRVVTPSEVSIRPAAPAHADDPHRGTLALVGVLAALAFSRLLWLDQSNSFLVVHPEDGRIPGISVPMYGDFQGVIRLVGYDVKVPSRLTLYWEAMQAPTANYEMVVTLLDGIGAEVKEVVNAYPGHNCTSNWAEGQLTRDEYTLPIDASWPAGTYRLQVGVRDSTTKQSLLLVDSLGGGEERALVGSIELPDR